MSPVAADDCPRPACQRLAAARGGPLRQLACAFLGHPPDPVEQPPERFASGSRIQVALCRRCGAVVETSFLIGRPGEAPIVVRAEEGRA